MSLSRGAQRCLEFLQSLSRTSGQAFPFQSTIAMRLGCDSRSVRRYIRELRDAGLVTVKKRQHSSAEYVLQTGHYVLSGVLSGAENVLSGQVYPCMSEKLSGDEKQARKPMGVEIPPEYILNQFGRSAVNPAFIQVRDALIFARERIARANDPEAYKRSIVRRVVGQ